MKSCEDCAAMFWTHGTRPVTWPAANSARCGTTPSVASPSTTSSSRLKTSAGDPIWLDVSGVTLGWGPDASVSWILLFRDLTASHEIESNVEDKTTTSPPRVNQPSPGKLTRRELQILWFMKEGAATATIADRLSISRSTVRNHIQNIFKKLDVHGCLEAVAVANRCGL